MGRLQRLFSQSSCQQDSQQPSNSRAFYSSTGGVKDTGWLRRSATTAIKPHHNQQQQNGGKLTSRKPPAAVGGGAVGGGAVGGGGGAVGGVKFAGAAPSQQSTTAAGGGAQRSKSVAVYSATVDKLVGGHPASSGSSRTMPLSLLPSVNRSTTAAVCGNKHGRGGGSGVWSSFVRGITGGSGSYRRSRTAACETVHGRRDASSHPDNSAAFDSFNNSASNGCYYYYYYSADKPADPASSEQATTSADIPPSSSLAPFPPTAELSTNSRSVNHHHHQAIAGFKLLLPIPIKRTISEGPRGPQLSGVCGGVANEPPVNSLAGLTPAAATEDYASTSMDVPTQGSEGDEGFSDAGDDAVTIWSDTSSCVFSDDYSHITTGQSAAAVGKTGCPPQRTSKVVKQEAVRSGRGK
eukprot:GHVS01008259.1.p1 GENE.GHVS01008259.1~~GHVS01008259.1.p1  ORF type:complete len:408 (+),score=136.02 GHVS01008259.1:160-1383(+)